MSAGSQSMPVDSVEIRYCFLLSFSAHVRSRATAYHEVEYVVGAFVFAPQQDFEWLGLVVNAQLTLEGKKVVVRSWGGSQANEHQVINSAVLISWGIAGYQASGEANAAERRIEKDLDETKALFVGQSYLGRATHGHLRNLAALYGSGQH